MDLNYYIKKTKRIISKRDVAGDTLIWLFSQAIPYWKQISGLLIINIIGLGMSFAGTIVGKYVVDATTAGRLNARYVIYMAVTTLLTILFSAFTTIFSSYVNERFSFGMRCDMFDRVQKSLWKELSKYHSEDILTRLTSDVSSVASGLITLIPNLIVTGLKFVIAFFILFYFDRMLAVFSLILGPIGAVASLVFRQAYRKYQWRLHESESEYRIFMQEILTNLSVTKAFQREESNNSYMHDIRKKRMDIVMKSARLSALMSALMRIVYNTGYIVAFCWCAYRISIGAITYGTMTVFLTLVNNVQGSVASLGSVIPTLYGMMVSAKRITDIVGIHDEIYLETETEPESIMVQVRDLTFAYDKRNVLENASFTVYPGETIGIIGPSGAGKTTLVRLLLSLVSPDSGSVEYTDENGVLEKAQPASRRFISYVPQGNTLFSGTIENNLRAGKEDATEAEIWESLRLADADKFVRKTAKGLKTVLNERGGGISEGQAQRIGIARALIRNKPLLILDEATSALDEDAEATILENIANHYGKTVFIITHRKSMLKYCQRIIEISEDAKVKVFQNNMYQGNGK